jgi:hypothetical protein
LAGMKIASAYANERSPVTLTFFGQTSRAPARRK